ncbi:MAG: elongation factor 1-beta [Candidatus Nanohaloarchaeota archaeon QJJ-9]|nr:elongation factor 1-beta [Candidatus Nanohaloarchaeota archaeon QJJ-9]
MGKIGVVLKLMPESPEEDLEKIKSEAKERVDVEDIGEEDVAFGLTAIKVSTIVEDAEGGTDEVEETLLEIEGVQSVEVDDIQKL